MTTATRADLVVLQAASERAEHACQEAAEIERAAYQRWQDAYGAYEVARDDASTAWHAWVGAIA